MERLFHKVRKGRKRSKKRLRNKKVIKKHYKETSKNFVTLTSEKTIITNMVIDILNKEKTPNKEVLRIVSKVIKDKDKDQTPKESRHNLIQGFPLLQDLNSNNSITMLISR